MIRPGFVGGCSVSVIVPDHLRIVPDPVQVRTRVFLCFWGVSRRLPKSVNLNCMGLFVCAVLVRCVAVCAVQTSARLVRHILTCVGARTLRGPASPPADPVRVRQVVDGVFAGVGLVVSVSVGRHAHTRVRRTSCRLFSSRVDITSRTWPSSADMLLRR